MIHGTDKHATSTGGEDELWKTDLFDLAALLEATSEERTLRCRTWRRHTASRLPPLRCHTDRHASQTQGEGVNIYPLLVETLLGMVSIVHTVTMAQWEEAILEWQPKATALLHSLGEDA